MSQFLSHRHNPLRRLNKRLGLAALALSLFITGIGSSTAQDDLPLTAYRQADLTRLTANVQRPNGIAWYDGNLYTACTGDSTIYEIDDTTGQTRTYIFGVRNAHMLHVEESPATGLTLWVPDFGDNSLSQVTRSGVRRIESNMSGAWGIAAVDESRFLITNLLDSTLNLVDRTGEREMLLDDLASPTGLLINDALVYLANTGSTRRAIEWYPLETLLDGSFVRADSSAQVLLSGIQNVTGLQMAPDNKLYFAFSQGTRGVVGRIDPKTCQENGGCTAEEIEIVLFTDLQAPLSGLTITPDGRMFVHEMFSPDLYWVQLDR